MEPGYVSVFLVKKVNVTCTLVILERLYGLWGTNGQLMSPPTLFFLAH